VHVWKLSHLRVSCVKLWWRKLSLMWSISLMRI
jgi:hypothetical protein